MVGAALAFGGRRGIVGNRQRQLAVSRGEGDVAVLTNVGQPSRINRGWDVRIFIFVRFR